MIRRVAFVSTYDARDIGTWSGTPRYMLQAMEEVLDSLEYVRYQPSKLRLLPFVVKRELYRRLRNERFLRQTDPGFLSACADVIARRLRRIGDVDVVFSTGCMWSNGNPLPHLAKSYKTAFWGDCTYADLLNFYPEFQNVCAESREAGIEAEKMLLESCRLAIYSSEWASRTAIQHYGIDPNKVKVIPFGANIDHSYTLPDLTNMIRHRDKKKCRLLFVGADWSRKGAYKAIEIARELNNAGLPSELTMVGAAPTGYEPPEYVRLIGVIDKRDPQEQKRYAQLWSESHFFLLPSIADCSPIVLCEANAFGVPCLSTRVGGIPTIVRENVNGFLFDIHSPSIEYASCIYSAFSDDRAYEELALSSFHEYISRLNWGVAAKQVQSNLAQL